MGCKRCPLWKPATQTVFGEGPGNARVLVVGEQPGDQEDLSGHPFVGPSGKLFDRALEELGIDRSRFYVTNAVKHFKFERRGKARLHKSPNAGEQFALPEAIGALRQVRKAAGDGAIIAVSASDPLNLAGTVLPGSKVPRLPGARVAYRDGIALAALVAGEVQALAALSAEDAEAVRRILLREPARPEHPVHA
jgi:DNA polymerase